MQLDWERLFRRYVYDPEKTPYLTAAGKLTKSQANNEILVFALFSAIFFAVAGAASLTGRLPDGGSVIVPVFAFFTVWTAFAFWWSKNQMAAAFVALGPLAVLAYFAVYGFVAALGTWDRVLVVAALLLWLRYNWRIVRIAAAYPSMPPGEPPRRGRRNPYA